jgi:hypothetical protein
MFNAGKHNCMDIVFVLNGKNKGYPGFYRTFILFFVDCHLSIIPQNLKECKQNVKKIKKSE